MALSKNKSQNSEFWSLINRRMKMRYIVNNEEVSRDTFYFCQRAKEENKSFVLLNPTKGVESYINDRPEFDYYICDEIRTYVTKGEKTVTEWFEKDEDYSWSKCTPEDMTKRYQKSKFKDTMTFEEWYKKNGWTLKSETKYEIECYDILIAEDFEEKDVKIKLFSVKVKNDDTVKTINKIRDERGNFCVKYVLRNDAYTEIIYEDTYKEI